MYAICDSCQETKTVKLVTIAVRTETCYGDLSTKRFVFKQVPLCAECAKTAKAIKAYG
jgi:hypothetical protein